MTAAPTTTTPATQSPGAAPTSIKVDPRAAALVTAEAAVRLRAVPFGFERPDDPSSRLLIAMVDTSDLAAADEVALLAGLPVKRQGVSPNDFDQLLRSAFGATAAQMAMRLAGGAEAPDQDALANLEAVDAADVQRMA